jgi:hypothetical protein
MNLFKAIVRFMLDECGAVSGSFPEGGGFSYSLTSPEETQLSNATKPGHPNDPYRTNAWGSYEDPFAAERANQEQAQRERAMTERMQNQAKMMQSDINKRDIINAFVGGGKVAKAGGGFYDPTKQFATLLGQMGTNDSSTLDINNGAGTGGQGDYNQLYNQLQAMMQQRGGSYENDINQSAGEAQKTQAARMQARGLGGSTLVDAGNARIDRDRQQAVNKLHDTLLGQDIGTLSSVGIEGLRARQRQQEFSAQMKLANNDRGMKLFQTLLGA